MLPAQPLINDWENLTKGLSPEDKAKAMAVARHIDAENGLIFIPIEAVNESKEARKSRVLAAINATFAPNKKAKYKDKVFHEDCKGIHEVDKHYDELVTALPDDLRIRVSELSVASDGKIIVKANISGTHKGEWKGLKATQRKLNFDLMAIFKVAKVNPEDAGYKITHEKALYDGAHVLRQLGIYNNSAAYDYTSQYLLHPRAALQTSFQAFFAPKQPVGNLSITWPPQKQINAIDFAEPLKEIRASFPEASVQVNKVHETKDSYLLETTVTGKHTGTHWRGFPKTGYEIKIPVWLEYAKTQGQPLLKSCTFDPQSIHEQIGISHNPSSVMGSIELLCKNTGNVWASLRGNPPPDEEKTASTPTSNPVPKQ